MNAKYMEIKFLTFNDEISLDEGSWAEKEGFVSVGFLSFESALWNGSHREIGNVSCTSKT